MKNTLISEYMYLAEASYTDFQQMKKQLKRISGS